VSAHVGTSQRGSTAITLDSESGSTKLQPLRPQVVQELFAAQAGRRPNALAMPATCATLTHAELASTATGGSPRCQVLAGQTPVATQLPEVYGEFQVSGRSACP
jgi:hypothetical protein